MQCRLLRSRRPRTPDNARLVKPPMHVDLLLDTTAASDPVSALPRYHRQDAGQGSAPTEHQGAPIPRRARPLFACIFARARYNRQELIIHRADAVASVVQRPSNLEASPHIPPPPPSARLSPGLLYPF